MHNMEKLYSTEELKKMQKEGKFPISKFSLLNTKYKDRWDRAADLMNIVDHDFILKTHNQLVSQDEAEVRLGWERLHSCYYITKYEGDVFSHDIDYYYDEPGDDSYYAMRKKIYLCNGSRETYEREKLNIPEIEYFLDFYDDIRPIMEHYARDNFPEIEDFLYRFMIIEYSYPTATEDHEVPYHEQRKFNTESFGPDHCDETLGGFHLGENQKEFQAQNTKTGDWEYIPDLENDGTLWMFGEYGEDHGWMPTYHQMVHNPDPTFGTRYSIIVDLHIMEPDDEWGPDDDDE